MHGKHISEGLSQRTASRKVGTPLQVREGVSCCSSAGHGIKGKHIWVLCTLLGRVRDTRRTIKNLGFAGTKLGCWSQSPQCGFICQMGTLLSTFQGHCEDRIMYEEVRGVPCQHSIIFTPIFSVFILILHHHLGEGVRASQIIRVM